MWAGFHTEAPRCQENLVCRELAHVCADHRPLEGPVPEPGNAGPSGMYLETAYLVPKWDACFLVAGGDFFLPTDSKLEKWPQAPLSHPVTFPNSRPLWTPSARPRWGRELVQLQ